MKNSLNKVVLVVVILAVAPAMGACAAQEKSADFGQQMRTEGLEKTSIGKSWEKGKDLEAKGLKNISRGEDLISDGEKKRERAEKLLKEAQEDLKDGRQKIRKGNSQIAEGRKKMQSAMEDYQSNIKTGSVAN